jgi:hypothetical protein
MFDKLQFVVPSAVGTKMFIEHYDPFISQSPFKADRNIALLTELTKFSDGPSKIFRRYAAELSEQ